MLKDDSNIPVKKIKFSNDSTIQKITTCKFYIIPYLFV